MPNLRNKKNKLIVFKLNNFLTNKLRFLSILKNKKIKFNSKPFSSKKIAGIDESQIDLHLQIAKKIDELNVRNEKELQIKKPESFSKRKKPSSISDIIEIREPSIKRPEFPYFKTKIENKNSFGELSREEELFDIENPSKVILNDEKEQINSNFNSWMLNNLEKKSKKPFMGFVRIKVRDKENSTNEKDTEPKKLNNYTITKNELEQTKKEIEENEKALEEAIKEEKELIQRIGEKKKEEKLKRSELKKKLKEKLIEEKKAEKDRIERDKELKKLDIEQLREEKLRNIEKAKELIRLEQERLKHIENEKELIRLEQEKLIEEQLKEKELRLKKAEVEKIIDINKSQKETKEEKSVLDDLEKLVLVIDQILAKLPDDVIDDFAQSEEFLLYEKVINKYKKK
jgi:hypothetical protein